MMFKQGTLNFEDYIFERALPNRIVIIVANTAIKTDVFVQQLDENAVRQLSWKRSTIYKGKHFYIIQQV